MSDVCCLLSAQLDVMRVGMDRYHPTTPLRSAADAHAADKPALENPILNQQLLCETCIFLRAGICEGLPFPSHSARESFVGLFGMSRCEQSDPLVLVKNLRLLGYLVLCTRWIEGKVGKLALKRTSAWPHRIRIPFSENHIVSLCLD